MNTMRFSPKIAADFCGILLMVIALAAPHLSAKPVSQPTLQDVLDAIAKLPPAWSQVLPSAQRFLLVMDGVAVLDKQTGLVWEQAPTHDFFPYLDGLSHCYNLRKGGRYGWHLPRIEQLMSLMNRFQLDGLPADHPFASPGGTFYLSSSTYEGNPGAAWVGDFYGGGTGPAGGSGIAWCVRGGPGMNPQ